LIRKLTWSKTQVGNTVIMSVRQSKVRHVFGTAAKAEYSYTDLRVSVGAFDTDYVKANTKYFAIPWQSAGGPLAVLKHGDVGRIGSSVQLLSGHTGQIVDFAFHPFDQSIIATGSVDTTAKIWVIPEEKEQTVTQPQVTLEGHSKKLATLIFHPTANHVLTKNVILLQLEPIYTTTSRFILTSWSCHFFNHQSLAISFNL
jgi:coronin-1B/1C/6